MKSPRNASSRALLVVGLEHVGRDREDVAVGHALRQRRDELVVDEDDAVDLLLGVELGHPVRDRLRIAVRRPVREADEGIARVAAAERQRRAPLLADGDPPHRLPLGHERPLEGERAADHLAVERAREAAVAGQRHDQDGLDRLALLQERQRPHRRGSATDAGDEIAHRVGVRAHRLDPRLGPPQLRGGDELERAGDLPRVGDGLDPPLEILDRRHLAGDPLLLHDAEALDELRERRIELRHGLVAEVLRLADLVVEAAARCGASRGAPPGTGAPGRPAPCRGSRCCRRRSPRPAPRRATAGTAAGSGSRPSARRGRAPAAWRDRAPSRTARTPRARGTAPGRGAGGRRPSSSPSSARYRRPGRPRCRR